MLTMGSVSGQTLASYSIISTIQQKSYYLIATYIIYIQELFIENQTSFSDYFVLFKHKITIENEISKQITHQERCYANNMELVYLDANQYMGYQVFLVQIKQIQLLFPIDGRCKCQTIHSILHKTSSPNNVLLHILPFFPDPT